MEDIAEIMESLTEARLIKTYLLISILFSTRSVHFPSGSMPAIMACKMAW